MQNQQTQKPQQRELTSQELDLSSTFTQKWNKQQLAMIWKRKMPAGCTLDDFHAFLYLAEVKNLDPLLGNDLYCRRQWDGELGGHKLLIMEGIHGLIKLCDATGLLDGITTSIEEKDGVLISATAIVHKKGCAHPFTATAYFEEYAAYKSADVLVKIWREKGRVMLQKCAMALALRLAFGAALGGLSIEEEFRDMPTPPPPPQQQTPDGPAEFVIPEIPKAEAETLHCGCPVAGQGSHEFVEHLSTCPTMLGDIARAKENNPDVVPMPDKLTKQEQIEKNRAISQRVLIDLKCEPATRVATMQNFIMGYLGIDKPTKDPFEAYPALMALDKAVTADTEQARLDFNERPLELGARLKKECV